MGISLSLNCPHCGGTLSVEEGARTTSCPYCSALLAIEGDDGVDRITYQDGLDRGRAVAIARNWMGGGLKARDLKGKAEVTECYPIYVPFWKLRARAAGWVFGYREVRRDKHTERVPMEKMVAADFDWNEIACDAGDIGVQRLGRISGTATLHDPGTIPTFEATTSPADARAKGLESIERDAIASAGVPRKTFVRMHVFPRGLSLVFYPIWVVRYRYNGRMYFCTVDGVTGQVQSGRAPGDTLMRAIAMSAGMLIGGYGSALGLLAIFYLQSQEGAAIGAAVIVACLAIAFIAYRYYRYGSEVTTGTLEGGFNASLGLGKGAGVEKELLEAISQGVVPDFGRGGNI